MISELFGHGRNGNIINCITYMNILQFFEVTHPWLPESPPRPITFSIANGFLIHPSARPKPPPFFLGLKPTCFLPKQRAHLSPKLPPY